jgi:hypothetical protein
MVALSCLGHDTNLTSRVLKLLRGSEHEILPSPTSQSHLFVVIWDVLHHLDTFVLCPKSVRELRC